MHPGNFVTGCTLKVDLLTQAQVVCVHCRSCFLLESDQLFCAAFTLALTWLFLFRKKVLRLSCTDPSSSILISCNAAMSTLSLWAMHGWQLFCVCFISVEGCQRNLATWFWRFSVRREVLKQSKKQAVCGGSIAYWLGVAQLKAGGGSFHFDDDLWFNI